MFSACDGVRDLSIPTMVRTVGLQIGPARKVTRVTVQYHTPVLHANDSSCELPFKKLDHQILHS
jgi:hypothetical protein